MLKLAVIIFSLTILCQQIQAQSAPLSCSPNPCGINNLCLISNGTVQCTCLNTNQVGSRCQLANPCNNKPCGTNGACFPVVKTINGVEYAVRMCQCYSGFSGINCEVASPKPCASNPCYNNGICIDKPNTWDYVCNCVGPYTGKNCASYIDYCGNNLCQNNAICIPDVVGQNYTCGCTNGFYGDLCQYEINECNVTLGYDQYGSPCQNNGTCFDLIDNYFCECTGTYTGTNCESYVDPCNPNPCGSGAQCSATQYGYTCTCAPGFFGNPCVPNPCLSNPCLLPGSRCVPVQPGTLITSGGCTCPTTGPTYICVCPATNPEFASTVC